MCPGGAASRQAAQAAQGCCSSGWGAHKRKGLPPSDMPCMPTSRTAGGRLTIWPRRQAARLG